MNTALDHRLQRLRWTSLSLAAAAAAVVLSATKFWYTFAFLGDVQVQVGSEVVQDVSASSTLSAPEAAAAVGADWFGYPRPLVLLAVALSLGAAAVATRLWVASLAAIALILPAANSQLGAFTSQLERGPGGHLLTRGPGLGAFSVAFWATAFALVAVTVAARAARQAELAAEREALRAAGQEVPPTLGEMVRGAVGARLRLPAPARRDP